MNKTDIITYNKFLGVYRIEDPLLISKIKDAIALKTATNFDITKSFQLRSRDGRTLVLSGNYKNLWSNGSIYLATKNSMLYRIYPGSIFTEALLYMSILEDQVDYANIGDLIYITDNNQVLVFDTNTIRPLRSTTRYYKAPMPGGHLIELYKSRMFIAKEVSNKHLIIQSEGGNYERYDQRDDSSFQAFPEKLSMLKGVNDGLFVSSDRTYFLEGNNLNNMKMTRVADYKAISGTAKKVKGLVIGGEYYSDAVLWESERGICIGGNGGKFINLTEGRQSLSAAINGTSYIKLGEINQFVVNTKGG